MSDKVICKHIIIKGHVQGVGFRDWTYRTAKKIGMLKGWVRNLDNGDVEILVQGDAKKVEELVSWCHKGPANARVDVVNADEVQVEPALTSFGIRRM